MDERQFVKTGVDLTREDLETAQWPLTRRPYQFETSLPRVFAVGDVRSGSMQRVASAVGEGSIAIQLIQTLLSSVNGGSFRPQPYKTQVGHCMLKETLHIIWRKQVPLCQLCWNQYR